MASVRQGGLYRCCVVTAEEAENGINDGDIIFCQYCKEPMVWKDGAYEWLGDTGEDDE